MNHKRRNLYCRPDKPGDEKERASLASSMEEIDLGNRGKYPRIDFQAVTSERRQLFEEPPARSNPLIILVICELEIRQAIDVHVAFLALEDRKSYEIDRLRQMRGVRAKCNEFDVMMCKQPLDLLVEVRTAVVTEENAGEILKFQGLKGRREVLKNNIVQVLCQHGMGDRGCLV
jgi:hypothetical protein